MRSESISNDAYDDAGTTSPRVRSRSIHKARWCLKMWTWHKFPISVHRLVNVYTGVCDKYCWWWYEICSGVDDTIVLQHIHGQRHALHVATGRRPLKIVLLWAKLALEHGVRSCAEFFINDNDVHACYMLLYAMWWLRKPQSFSQDDNPISTNLVAFRQSRYSGFGFLAPDVRHKIIQKQSRNYITNTW